MQTESLIGFLIIGLAAGWLGSKVLKGKGSGLLLNMVFGLIGAYVGGFLFNLMDLSAGGMIGQIVMATIGALLVIWLVDLMKSRG